MICLQYKVVPNTSYKWSKTSNISCIRKVFSRQLLQFFSAINMGKSFSSMKIPGFLGPPYWFPTLICAGGWRGSGECNCQEPLGIFGWIKKKRFFGGWEFFENCGTDQSRKIIFSWNLMIGRWYFLLKMVPVHWTCVLFLWGSQLWRPNCRVPHVCSFVRVVN